MKGRERRKVPGQDWDTRTELWEGLGRIKGMHCLHNWCMVAEDIGCIQTRHTLFVILFWIFFFPLFFTMSLLQPQYYWPPSCRFMVLSREQEVSLWHGCNWKQHTGEEEGLRARPGPHSPPPCWPPSEQGRGHGADYEASWSQRSFPTWLILWKEQERPRGAFHYCAWKEGEVVMLVGISTWLPAGQMAQLLQLPCSCLACGGFPQVGEHPMGAAELWERAPSHQGRHRLVFAGFGAGPSSSAGTEGWAPCAPVFRTKRCKVLFQPFGIIVHTPCFFPLDRYKWLPEKLGTCF